MLIQHINSITHEGKVVVVGTEEVVGKEKVGKIWYKVKQDGFEDSYLNQKPEERTGWEDWKPLELPNEADDQSVLDQEKVELTDQNNNYLLRSRYKTQDQSAVAPVQLVSGLGHIYIFRQSKSNTLLVDRFVLDGLTNALNRKLEVRFKRSKQKHTPSKNQKKGVSGLINIDSLDFVDINGKNFYEPTTELSLINNLSHGWFSVVLVPTNEQDKYRWHIFAYNSQTQKVEITTLRASDEGLFDLKDYTVLDPEPRNIPGIIKRALTITGLTVANGLTATKYDLQKERQTDDGMQLLRESTRVMLVVGTNQGNVAAISFAVAADGTLSEIEDSSDSTTIRRSNTRQILLPLNTLDEIKAIGTTNPPPEGKITGFARGEDDEVVLTSDEAAKLDETKSHQIKVTGNRDYNRSYSPVTKIDENTFEITPESANEITPERPNGGNWEVVREEETGLIFNGIVTAYEITEAGKLKVTALNHGLDDGDAVQVIDTKDYNGTYTVTKVDQKSFSLDGIKWQAGTAISAKLQTQKRQGVIFDGLDDYIQLPLSGTALSSDFTVEAWIKPSQLGRENPVLGTGAATDNRNQLLHLVVRDQSPYLGFCENDTPGKTSLSANTWYHVAFRYSKDKQEQAIFVNGVLDNSTQGHAAFAGTGQLKIGSAATKDHFLGCIADVRIWDKARTADEIKNSMYLQLTGKEVGLVGYWRLDAIVEGKERKVIDFSVNGNDGIVQGGAYISSVRLERNLPGTTTPAIKYENEELFAVSERTTYTEEFEFRTDNDVVPDKADGIKGKLFALTYKGKKNRNSQDWITIPIDPEETKFTPLDKDKPNTWWKASSRFTVPDGVSMVRSFGIDDIKGSWTTLEIRKHQIQLVSDSITEKNYTHDVSNLTLKEGNQLQLQESLKLMSLKEKQEGFLLKEKKELEANIAAYNAKTDTIAKIKDLEGQINKLTDTESKLSSEYTKEKENPFNYYCHLSCKGFDLKRGSDSRVQVYERNGVYRLELQAPSDGDWQKLKFVRAEDNDSYYIYCKGFDLKRGSDSRVQVYYRNDVFGLELLGPSNSDWQKLKFVRAEDNDSYHIYCKADSRRVQVYVHTDVYGLELLGPSNSEWQKLKLTPTNEQANNNISIAWKAYDDSTRNLDGLRKDLDALKIALGAEEGQNQKWKDRLKIVIKEIEEVQRELINSNNEFINALKKNQQTPQIMSSLKPDSRGLITQCALLGFVRPASRLSAIETCEGNVQLSYFDDQGRMRQTNFDATYDSKNSAAEQWIPDSLRTCLNFNKSSSIVTLDPPVYLGEEWTIEAWFAYPLAEVSEWNTLTRGKDTDHYIIVKREANAEQLGVYLNNGGGFFESGYNMRKLSPGWHHLTAVAQGKGQEAKTTFYINGNKVGESKGKTTSNVYTIGNDKNGAQQFGKVAEVRIWGIALSAEEIAVNSKTLLTGNEPALLAYYPFNEATDNSVKDKTGREKSDGTISGASWWGCAAPIGNLGHQVMQFDGQNDYISCPPLNADFSKGITVEAWVWYDKFNSWSRIIDFANGTDADNIFFANIGSSNDLEFSVFAGKTKNSISASKQLEIGKWMHLVATIDAAGKATLYKNGNAIGTSSVPLPKNLNRANNYIGKSNWTQDGYFMGKISDVRIWNKDRTQAEIQADRNKRLTGKEPGLVVYYPLSIQPEGLPTEVLDLVNNNHGTVTEAILVSDQTLPIGSDALVSCEYNTISKDRSAMMRRFFAAPTSQGVYLLPDKRIEQLELKWIGNGQFAPTLLGYIEGAPPIPSENLTLEEGYVGATSVELALSEDVTFNWKRSQDSGLGGTVDIFAGSDAEANAGFGFTTKIAKIRTGFKGNLDFSYQFQNESSITASSSLSMTDKLQLVGTQEQNAKFPHLGKRFIPKNVGYALVISALADVFVTRLQRTGKMIGYQVLPVENIPPDINTITFLINPAYTMNGSLDGLTGSSATSTRFFKHVPAMRSQFGSLYPASYYRLQEAYDLKKQIEQQDKNREAYFAQFNSLLVDEASLDRETKKGAVPGKISSNPTEDKPQDNLTEEQKKAADQKKQAKLEQETNAAIAKQSEAEKKKRAEIDQKIKDEQKKSHANASFAAWQRKMEDIQIRAGKRNIVNTYVWDADGGLRAEAQSFANTAEHSIGGSFSLNAGVGFEGKFAGGGVGVELTAQATINLTQTMTKTETRSKGIQLNVDLSGVENRGVTDHNDYPILPGEKVNRYRFMSFYLEGSTNNFNDFFTYVVDPEWLASNGEEARALRQAKGKANKAWRVLHRVTYVERPALMGFGRDIRQLSSAESTTELDQLQDIQDKVENLEKHNAKMQRKLDEILSKLNP